MRRLALPSGRWSWLAPLLSLGAAAAVTAVVAALLLDDEEGAPSDRGPTTAERIAIRSAPEGGAAALGTLDAGERLRLDGRSPDGRWVAVLALGTGLAGWLPADVIEGLPDLDALAVMGTPEPVSTPTATATPTATPEVTPTLTPDHPDLIVSGVYARENRLVVIVANEGSADADGPIEVSVDGRPAHRIDVGKPLRPGDRLEQELQGEYVQRRAQVVVTVRGAALLTEENSGNNVYSGVVTPDAPNDIELASVEYGGVDPHLIVTVRNHSPIPIRGVITIGIRQTSPQDRLLLRDERILEVDAGAMQSFEFLEFTGIPLEFVRVIVSTDAISDADTANNSLPR